MLLSFPTLCVLAWAGSAHEEGTQFFELRIRPLLAEHCVRCHGPNKQRAGLRLDSLDELLTGGDQGPAVVPGDPDQSLLMQAVSYEDEFFQMPPPGKLASGSIENLRAWIEMGAPGPRGKALAAAKDEFDLEARRREQWAFQPLAVAYPPDVGDESWASSQLDRFILARLEEAQLRPAPAVDRRRWIRRASFVLTGLPPAPEEVEAFVRDPAPHARERVVDRLLASPQFGERWARHWLDLVGYAETRGHEFDYPLPNAWQYRDWVVRALNSDLAYDAFLREQMAGDLIAPARLHPETGANESVLGTGFWWLGEEAHSPVSTRADQCDRSARRIDAWTRATLALTVACARCHDHKFDPISQRDFYALAGFQLSSTYRQVRFETMEANRHIAAQLEELHDEVQEPLSRSLGMDLRAEVHTAGAHCESPGRVIVDYLRSDSPTPILQDGFAFVRRAPGEFDLSQDPEHPVREFWMQGAAVFDPAWDVLALAEDSEVEPGSLDWPRSGRTLLTPTFTLELGQLHMLVRGAGHVWAAVDGHKMIHGPLHKALVHSWPAAAGFQWIELDLSDYVGHRLHLELSPAAEEHSGFAVARIVEAEQAPAQPATGFTRGVELGDEELMASKSAAATRRRELCARIQTHSRTAPALLDGSGADEFLLLRGNPQLPADPVPRRFLEALQGDSWETIETGSGRLELAHRLTDPGNPLPARVWVNRLWHHVMGRGIVATVDDFGRQGREPTHPELLDWLARRLIDAGWSTKLVLRELLLSSTFAMDSRPDPGAVEIDPGNELRHHWPLRRLEAEAIRDSILSVSGELDERRFGPPVPVHLTPFMEGRGRPEESGPLDGAGRRSLYLAVRRNFPTAFFEVFDAPPSTAVIGRRSRSNVPAQALALMNDPFVLEQAKRWAHCVCGWTLDESERIDRFYQQAFSRGPSQEEKDRAIAFLEERRGDRAAHATVWQDFAHALLQTKEFTYLR